MPLLSTKWPPLLKLTCHACSSGYRNVVDDQYDKEAQLHVVTVQPGVQPLRKTGSTAGLRS